MKKLKKSWAGVVMGAMLVGTLVGVVWARPHDTPEAQDITRKVTLGAGDFIPADDDDNWYNVGNRVRCSSGVCFFTAPVVFPCLPSVTVERIILHAEDGNAGWWAKAYLYRLTPTTGQSVLLGVASSPTGTAGYQPWSSGTINQVVWPSQRAYIWLAIYYTDIDVGGVTVEYHRNI